MDWTLKVGGQAGQGMQAIGSVLARAFARAGLHVFAEQDFESRIRGGHNFLQLRVGDKPVNALAARVDVLVALDASFAGARAMTATSGGGLCLMVEGIGLAGMTETPIVIVDAQRPGPSTGLPTRTEQGDLLFLIHAAHGEFPRAVLAPGDAEQAFYLTAKAFNLAEKYQMPVFVMTDQYLSDSVWTTTPLDTSRITIERGELLKSDAPEDYRRYRVTASGVSPRVIPGAGPALVVAGSDEHTDEGHITESADVRTEMHLKRMRKLERARAEMSPPERYGPENANVTLLAWGSNRHVAREAVDLLNEKQYHAANCFHFTDLWPFPAVAVQQLLRGVERLVSLENNAGAQFARLLRMETGIHVKNTILKFDGRPFLPEHVADAVRREALA